MSDWNLYLERKLALDLGLEASRLADSIARNTLGWNTRENEIGQQLLRDEARLHGRSFDRARDELVAAGLLRFTRGSPGRGHRDRYELLLEKPADERAIGREKPAEKPAQKPARERGRKEKGERKTTVAPVADATGREREKTVFDGKIVEAVKDLAAVLDDADDKTYLTFLRNFGDLPAECFDYTADQVERRVSNGDGPRSDSRYAFGILLNIAERGLPGDA